MVRLVFRTYTHVRRTICTSVPLRTSTRVSPGFVLAVRSSRSFGSQRTRSCSNLSKKSRSADSAKSELKTLLYPASINCLILAFTTRFNMGLFPSPLACASDSLVRVSRRDTRGRQAGIMMYAKIISIQETYIFLSAGSRPKKIYI